MKIAAKFQMGVIRPCRKQDLDPRRPHSVQRVCLYTKRTPRRFLGRHPSLVSARRQEAVIQMRKRGG